jgi:hypothetical protein
MALEEQAYFLVLKALAATNKLGWVSGVDMVPWPCCFYTLGAATAPAISLIPGFTED